MEIIAAGLGGDVDRAALETGIKHVKLGSQHGHLINPFQRQRRALSGITIRIQAEIVVLADTVNGQAVKRLSTRRYRSPARRLLTTCTIGLRGQRLSDRG